MHLPASPFDAISILFLDGADSDLRQFLVEAHGLLVSCPALVASADADLDAHGCGKQALRLADVAWRAERTAFLPGSASEPIVIDPARLTLAQGRPRTPAQLMIDRMEQNQEIVTRYLNDPTFQSAAFKSLISRLYKEIRRDDAHPPSSR